MARSRISLDAFEEVYWSIAEWVRDKGELVMPMEEPKARSKGIALRSRWHYFRKAVKESPPGASPRADSVRATIGSIRATLREDNSVKFERFGETEWLAQAFVKATGSALPPNGDLAALESGLLAEAQKKGLVS